MTLKNDRKDLNKGLDRPLVESDHEQSITGAHLYSRLQRTQKQRNWTLPVVVAGVAITGAAVALTSGQSETVSQAQAATLPARDGLKLAQAAPAAAKPEAASFDVRAQGLPDASASPAPSSSRDAPPAQAVRPAPRPAPEPQAREDESPTAAPASPATPAEPASPAVPATPATPATPAAPAGPSADPVNPSATPGEPAAPSSSLPGAAGSPGSSSGSESSTTNPAGAPTGNPALSQPEPAVRPGLPATPATPAEPAQPAPGEPSDSSAGSLPPQ